MGFCRFDHLSIYCVFIYYFNVFFFRRTQKSYPFLEKSIIKIIFKIKVNFSLCNTEETKILIIIKRNNIELLLSSALNRENLTLKLNRKLLKLFRRPYCDHTLYSIRSCSYRKKLNKVIIYL